MTRMPGFRIAATLGAGLGALLLVFAASTRLQAQADADIGPLLDDLVAANHILYQHGVLDGYGHVSVRHPARPDHFLMAAALAPARIAAKDVIEFDLDGKALDANGRSVYAERFIHAEIYRARPDVNAVVHSHSPTVIPFSVTGVPLRPIMHTATFLHEGAPVFEIRDAGGMTDMLVSNPALAKALVQTLGKGAVVLMRGHGDTVVGPDVRTAVTRAIYTEVDARLLLQALSLGKPITYIAPEEIEEREAASTLGKGRGPRGSSSGTNRSWEMWIEEAAGKSAGGAR